MIKTFKSFITKSIIAIFIFSSCIIIMPKPAKAKETALRRVFVDTLFGLATGTVIATALTIADGDAHSDDWGRNIGIGATIGAFVGATYGIAEETRHFATFDGNRLDFHIPLPRIYRSPGSKNSNHSPGLFFDLIRWYY